MLKSSFGFDKAVDFNLAGLIVLFEELLFFHSAKISESSNSQRVLTLFLLERDLKLKVLEFSFLGADIRDDAFGWQFDALNREVLAVVNVNLNVVEADIGALSNFIVALEVSLKVIFRGTYSDFRGIFEDEGVLGADIEKEWCSLERCIVELSLYMSVDEGWNAWELHLKTIIARPIHNLTY